LNGSGNATPQVGIVLERLHHMLASGMEEPEVCYLWLDIVHQEYRARNQVATAQRYRRSEVIDSEVPT